MKGIGRGYGSGLVNQPQNRADLAFLDAVAGLRDASPTWLTDSRFCGRHDHAVPLFVPIGRRRIRRVTFVSRVEAIPLDVLSQVPRNVLWSGHFEHASVVTGVLVNATVVARNDAVLRSIRLALVVR